MTAKKNTCLNSVFVNCCLQPSGQVCVDCFAGGVLTASKMALKIGVLRVANAMDALEVSVRAEHERLAIDDMLRLSTNAAAGQTG